MNKYAYCTTCKKIFETSRIGLKFEYGNGTCPTEGCKGEAFGIDEDMIIPISILNDKGYITDWCCSGHIFDDNSDGYIAFHGKRSFPASVPDGWYQDCNDYRFCIRCHNRDSNPIKRRELIKKHMDSLITWALGLEKGEQK